MLRVTESAFRNGGFWSRSANGEMTGKAVGEHSHAQDQGVRAVALLQRKLVARKTNRQDLRDALS